MEIRTSNMSRAKDISTVDGQRGVNKREIEAKEGGEE